MATRNQIVPEIVDFEVPETTSTDDAVVPSTTLHKMYIELMKSFKELKQENHDLKQENHDLNKEIEELKNKHSSDMLSMRQIAYERFSEIKKRKDEKADLEVVIDGLVDDNKDLQKMYNEAMSNKKKSPVEKKLKKELERAYKQEREDMDEIDELKMENKHFRERQSELSEDRNMLRDTIKDLRSVISRQHDELVMWQDCYEESWNYEAE